MSTDNIETRVENNEQMAEELETRELETRETRDYDISIFRFKFTEEFMEELYKFSKIHQYDERKDFKEAWNIWVDENTETIDSEMHRLIVLGYEGDILTKMFKSARYYFRKKSVLKKESVPRKSYEKADPELLKQMDTHIKENLDMKPHDSYIAFCKKIQEANAGEEGPLNAAEEEKLKKTFKNRHSTAKKTSSSAINT